MLETILITGGAGFVGSNLALSLKERSRQSQIFCFDNLNRRGSELNVPRLQAAGIQFIKGDVRNKKELLALPRIDAFIECSAEPSVLAGFKDPEYMIDTNLKGTLNCLELARRDGSGFIFLSTSRVYPMETINGVEFEEKETRFDWPEGLERAGISYQGVKEELSLNGPKSLYGATKLASEQIVTEYLAMFGLKGVINRLGVIAGPWQMGKIDQGIVGFWVMEHLFNGSLSYIGFGGRGKQVRDAVHIDDVCDLVFCQMNRLEELSGGIYNVGGGRANSFSLLELTRIVQEATGTSIPIASDAATRPADLRIYMTDNSRIRQATGWAPKKSMAEIVKDTVSWAKANESCLKDMFGR
ncbi:MAG TPA: NAD-dependent epimerase/dehydratase family protein [Candidatus Omnitrophota bacterium]|nr:NAD-dependent epimerase/dehydratase family protein [Candidatus Omnitrophota bacterium]